MRGVARLQPLFAAVGTIGQVLEQPDRERQVAGGTGPTGTAAFTAGAGEERVSGGGAAGGGLGERGPGGGGSSISPTTTGGILNIAVAGAVGSFSDVVVTVLLGGAW